MGWEPVKKGSRRPRPEKKKVVEDITDNLKDGALLLRDRLKLYDSFVNDLEVEISGYDNLKISISAKKGNRDKQTIYVYFDELGDFMRGMERVSKKIGELEKIREEIYEKEVGALTS